MHIVLASQNNRYLLNNPRKTFLDRLHVTQMPLAMLQNFVLYHAHLVQAWQSAWLAWVSIAMLNLTPSTILTEQPCQMEREARLR